MQPGCEADHLPPSSTEVKNECCCASTHPYGTLVQGQFDFVMNYLKQLYLMGCIIEV